MSTIITAEELRNKIALVERTLSQTEDKKSQMAQTMSKNLEKYYAQLKEIEGKEVQKKNDEQPDNEPVTGSTPSVSETNSVPVVDSDNTFVVDTAMDEVDNNKFTSLDAFYRFKAYKDKLRDYLRNWLKKKNKKEIDAEEMDANVRWAVSKILECIETSGNPKFKDSLKKRTYSIGDNTLCKELGKKEILYNFDIATLKKEYQF